VLNRSFKCRLLDILGFGLGLVPAAELELATLGGDQQLKGPCTVGIWIPPAMGSLFSSRLVESRKSMSLIGARIL